MASVGQKTFTVRIGKTFYKKLQFTSDGVTPVDLTGYGFKMQIRRCKSSDDLIYELISPTSIDTGDAANGNIILNIPSVATSGFTAQNAVYDLQWTDTLGNISTKLEGDIQIVETVTK